MFMVTVRNPGRLSGSTLRKVNVRELSAKCCRLACAGP